MRSKRRKRRRKEGRGEGKEEKMTRRKKIHRKGKMYSLKTCHMPLVVVT